LTPPFSPIESVESLLLITPIRFGNSGRSSASEWNFNSELTGQEHVARVNPLCSNNSKTGRQHDEAMSTNWRTIFLAMLKRS